MGKGKKHFKIRRQAHWFDETSKISSHSAILALPDQKENMFICAKSKEFGAEVCQNYLELVRNVQSIHDTVKHVASPEKIYYMGQAVPAILEYLKHQTRDSQQKKTKTTCFDDMNDASGIGIRNFSQKILLMKSSEEQQEYFISEKKE